MSDSPQNRFPLWKTLVVSALLIVPPLIGFVFITYSSGGLHSPPDEERPWALSSYLTTFDPARTTPLLTLADIDVPELDIKWEERSGADRKLQINFPSGDESEDNPFEIFEADSSGKVLLPDGNELQISAVALVLPQDGNWEGRNYSSVMPDWRDPFTGEKIPEANWQKEVYVSRENPKLYFRISNAGKAPLRWLSPKVYDSVSKSRIASSSSYSYTGDHGMFHVGLNIWHQTSIDIGVDFAFGDPESQEIELLTGGAARFGDNALIKVIEVLPNGHGSSSWGKGSNGVRTSFTPHKMREKSSSRTLLFQVWPPNNHKLAELIYSPEKQVRLLSGNYGISDIQFHDKKAEIKTGTIRRFPRLGRAVIHLDQIPRLLEVDNLFETPIKRTEIQYKHSFISDVSDAVLSRYSITSPDYEIDASVLPIVFTDTTPIQILEKFEELTGVHTYYDKEEFRLTNQKPETVFEKAWKEVQEFWNKWFP